MKKIIFSLVLSSLSANAMNVRENLLQEAKEIEIDLFLALSHPESADFQIILQRSENLALRSQDSGLEKEGIERVNFNPNQNSIVAWNHRSGNERNVTVTVIKYLTSGEFDVDATVTYSSGMMGSGKANPSIVEQLKKKIDEFEFTMPKK